MPAASTPSLLESPSALIPRWLYCRLVLCAATLLLNGTVGSAQFMLVPGANPSNENPKEQHARRLPRDPLLQSQFLQALQSLNDGNVADGLQLMQAIIDSGSDYLVSNGAEIQGNLRSEIDAAIIKHRAEYERLFGTAAKDALTRASELQDDESLLELCRTHGLTDSGATALEQLARRRQQQGDWIAAARAYERLIQHPAAGSQQATHVLAAIRCWSAAELPAVAEEKFHEHQQLLAQLSKQKNWPAPAELSCAEWLARITPGATVGHHPLTAHQHQWPVPMGSISQTGWTSSAPILSEPDWTYPLIDEYDQLPGEMTRLAKEMVTTIERQVRAHSERITLPAGRPLIVGNSVITSGYGVVRAIDRTTGELRWPGVVVDETFDFLFRSSYSPDHPQNADAMRSEMLEMFVTMRGWRDLTSASISTDGKRVYAISGCHLPSTLPANMLLYNPARDPRLPQKDNQLHAYDLRTGNLIWTMMGDVPINEFALEPGEEPPRHPVFFYGAPVPVNGRLFCIGEERGQVQLLELNPDARVEGEILWAIGLLNPDRDLLLEDRRRLAGMMPTYAGGLMICPTGEGTIAAVDIDRREIVWSHQYIAAEAQTREQILRMRGLQLRNANSPRQTAENLLDQERWFDARILVAGGKVVFTPPDSDDLVCLDLLTGEPVWTRTIGRHSTVYLGGTFQNSLIVVGQTDLELLSLNDGSRVWDHPLALAAPSGRGLRMESRFLQPLTTGEIAVVDLDAARVLCRLPLGEKRIAGNLAAADGQIVFQSGSEIVAFDPQSAVEQRLAELQSTSPAAPETLTLQGELDLQQGKVQQGIEQLQQALQRSGDARLKRILSWTLLEGLRTDFPTYERYFKDLGAYVSDDQRTLYLSTYAEGLRKHGREGDALDTYLTLLGEYSPTVRLDRQNSQWQCRYDRLIGGRLQQLNSSDEVRARITRFLQNIPADHPTQVLTTLELLGSENLPSSEIASRLEQLQVKDGDAVRRESLALQLLESPKPVGRAQGLELLALINLQHRDGIAAKRYLNLLENLPADVRLANGQSGAERAAALRADAKFQEVLAAAPDWPQHVHPDPDHRVSVAQNTILPMFGTPSKELSGWTFSIDATGININVYDSDGRLRGREGTGLTNNRSPIGPRFGRYVQVRGHLASVVCQDRVLLLDLLSQQGSPRLIANISLFSPDQHPGGARNVVLNHTNRSGLRGPGSRTFTITGSWAGNVGPLLAGTFCYTVGADLVAVDPATGLELWRHSGVPAGAEIIGDEQTITVVSTEEKRLMVLRTLNGELVREGPTPEQMLSDWKGIDWKGLLPTSEMTDKGIQLSAYDPTTDAIRWSHLIPASAAQTQLAGRALGYLTPEGLFRVLDVGSGQVAWETQLSLKAVPRSLRALSSASDCLLVTNAAMMSDDELGSAVPEMSGSGVRELFMLNSETGKLQWQREFAEAGDIAIPALPGRWPLIVVYLSQESEQPPRNGFPRGMRIQAMVANVLDRRTGKTVMRAEGVDTGNFVGWSGETQPFRAHIKYGSLTLSLKCLDTPPVDPPANEVSGPNSPPPQQESAPSAN